jgi:drug/metabolite transporter (DMT)-like permease
VLPPTVAPGFALLAALLFGLSAPASKVLIGTVDPWLLAGLLYLGSGLGLALYDAARRVAGSPGGEAPLGPRDLPWLAGAIASGGVAGPVLLMFGLALGTAAQSSLLLNLEGVFTALVAWVVFREHVDTRIALGMAAIGLGALALAWPGPAALGLDASAVLVAGACLAWAVDNNLTRRVAAGDPVQIAAIKGAVAGAVNVAVALVRGADWPAAGAVLAAGVVGFLGYGVSLVLFVLALRHLGTARTSAYFSTAPFVGALGGVLALAEPLTLPLGLAGSLMGAGVWLHLTERHTHEHEHGALAHDHRHRHDEHHVHDHPGGVDPDEPHSHWHVHAPLRHRHPHYPDLHHRHRH